MDGFTYLILEILPIITVVAVLFCALGWWFAASRYRRRGAHPDKDHEQLRAEVSSLREQNDHAQRDLLAARDELRRLKSGKAAAQSERIGGRDPAPLGEATSAKAGAAESGRPRLGGAAAGEIDLGEVFAAPPDQVDDLKRVRGIARVMESKLHAAGVFTYAQIARWSDAAAEEFGRRLGAPGSISRYNWRKQCAELHREKYHEDP